MRFESIGVRLVAGILFAASTVVAMPSAESVTIKNGVNCAKANATSKIGNKVYVCAKNPILKSDRRTWTLRNCLRASTLLVDAKEELDTWRGDLEKAGALGEKPLADFESTIKELEKTQASLCKRGA